MSLERAREQIVSEGLDALIATSFENVAYLSGAVIMTQRMIPDRLAAAVLPADAGLAPSLVVCTVEEPQARRDSRIADIRGYVEFSESPIDAIVDVLRAQGLTRGRLGIEMRVLSAHYYLELQKRLPGATLVAADRLLGRIRMIKSADEIRLLQNAALATDHAIRLAYESGRPGVSDKTIADRMANEIQSGADSLAFLVVGAGPSASLAHPTPSTRLLEEGDIIRCDVGGCYSGYYSDLARTAVVGKATPAQRAIYENLWAIHEETIGAARAGISARELFFHCQEAFERHNMRLNLPHIGHSLGLGLHEHPVLSPLEETVLEAGMVLAIEPVHKDSGPIFHVEDLIEVTADGGRVLSRSADWSSLLVIGG